MIIRSDIENAAAKQLSIDLCCKAEDLFKYENTVTAPKINHGRRVLTENTHFFRAATMGMGTVICADPAVLPYARLIAEQNEGAEIFSAAVVSAVNRELFGNGYCIGVCNQYYLPKTPYRPVYRKEGYTMSVFEGKDVERLYDYEGFGNSLLYKKIGERRDILAVCAVNGRRIMGIAGASSDSLTMAQIGVDVVPEFRGMGIGTSLVSACAAEVFRCGYVPYYGTLCSNIISQRLAAACDFIPAWCEMFSVPLDRA